MMVKGMEVMLAGDPKLDEDINPYNLPEVSIAINWLDFWILDASHKPYNILCLPPYMFTVQKDTSHRTTKENKALNFLLN